MAIKLLTSSSLLSASGGLYERAEAYDISAVAQTTSGCWQALNTTRTINVTFANSGNQLGLMFYIRNAYTGTVTMKLLEGSTTRTTNTFNLTTSPITMVSSALPCWYYFALDTYAVTTAGSTWKYEISCSSSTPQMMSKTSAGTDWQYMVFLDQDNTKITSSDTLVLKQGVVLTVDESVTHAKTENYCILQGANSTYQVTEADLSAPITITPNGANWVSATANFYIGSSDAPIPVAKKVTIDISGNGLLYFYWAATSTSYFGANRTNGLRFYGAEDNYLSLRVTEDAASGQADIKVSADYSAIWQVGDKIALIGKNRAAFDGVSGYTINAITSDTITLNKNLDYPLLAGGGIVNGSRGANLGIVLTGLGTQSFCLASSLCDYIDLVGVYCYRLGFTGGSFVTISKKTKTCLIRNVMLDTAAGATPGMLNMNTAHGSVINGIYIFNERTTYASIPMVSVVGNNMTVSKIFCKGFYTSTQVYTVNTVLTVVNISGNGNTVSEIVYSGGRISTTAYNDVFFCGAGNTISDVFIFANSFRVLSLMLTNSTLSGLVVNGAGMANICLANCVNAELVNPSIGETLAAGTAEIEFIADTLNQAYLTSPNFGSFASLVMSTDLAVSGSFIRIQDYQDTFNDNRGYETSGNTQSTGTGLDDTTVKTAGGYALRLEPISGDTRIEWTQLVPTGNIQGKTMVVGIWCKINSADYYSGTHGLPKLTVKYDGSTSLVSEATASTDWQYLSVAITPTTTSGQIEVTCSARTDQTGSSAYVYFDDISILYPAGYQLDLGSMDIWSKGLPVSPTIATNLSALSVWASLDSINYGTGSLGEKLKKLKNPSLLIDGEVIV
jgi:hypothetical protein